MEAASGRASCKASLPMVRISASSWLLSTCRSRRCRKPFVPCELPFCFPRPIILRKPGIGRLLNLGSGKYAGLSSYLAGVSSLDLVSVPHPAIPNLVAIPTGPLPPNPADLLSSHKLADAIAELRTKFKFIVIDSPPIMAATDAVILSVQADGVLLVVRSGETPKEAFTRTRDLLTSVKCHILGVVLNAVDSSAPDYYYSYRYYPYSEGYGPQEPGEAFHSEHSESVAEPVIQHYDDEDDTQAL